MSDVGDYRRCKTCGDFGWFGGRFSNHVCKPTWECRLDRLMAHASTAIGGRKTVID